MRDCVKSVMYLKMWNSGSLAWAQGDWGKKVDASIVHNIKYGKISNSNNKSVDK